MHSQPGGEGARDGVVVGSNRGCGHGNKLGAGGRDDDFGVFWRIANGDSVSTSKSIEIDEASCRGWRTSPEGNSSAGDESRARSAPGSGGASPENYCMTGDECGVGGMGSTLRYLFGACSPGFGSEIDKRSLVVGPNVNKRVPDVRVVVPIICA